jgi:hypothetical protein
VLASSACAHACNYATRLRTIGGCCSAAAGREVRGGALEGALLGVEREGECASE